MGHPQDSEPDALTAPIQSNGGRFWDGATLNRLSLSFMLDSYERARSTHPKSTVGRESKT